MQGTTDYPASIFVEELAAAYPEAAIILTTRPQDSWIKSMNSTIIYANQQALERLKQPGEKPGPMNELSRAVHRYRWTDDFDTRGADLFAEHNDAVRRVGQGRRFLEFEAASGWGPLCEFLGVPVPDVAFPRQDDWAKFKWKRPAAGETAEGSLGGTKE